MPSLIVSSRYTTDSQVLRQFAQDCGWETLRLDGCLVPDWFDPPDEQIALFYTAPHAFDIAAQLSRTLLGCSSDWTVQLPSEFLLRDLRQMTLGQALELAGESFVKHSVSKAFPPGIYNTLSLATATSSLHSNTLVHVGEPVEWAVEYRCFVIDGEIAAISPYKRHGQIIKDHSNLLGASRLEIDEARGFASSVLESSRVHCPPAFVLDIGTVVARGWAVIEVNECWASGIYACNPKQVLDTLLRACVPTQTLTDYERHWDFKQHYVAACS